MDQNQITIVARFTAKAGKADELRRELLALVPLTRAEPGNVNYDLHESTDTPGQFVFYENFASPAAHAEHAAKPYIERLLSEICTELCEGELDVTTWRMISKPED